MLEKPLNLKINNLARSLQLSPFQGVGLTPYPIQNSPRKDSFNTNPLYTDLSSKQNLELIIKMSPEIQDILREYKIPPRINMRTLENLKTGHMMDARVLTAKIYSSLPADLKQQINLMDLQQAAMLHDYGKILIPDKILNKKSTLTEEEKKIMEQHSVLGYELLKRQGVKPEVLKLIKYHHQTHDGKGYPDIDADFEYTPTMQVLQAADKYSALTEQRSYKSALNEDEALQILYEDVADGIISPEVYNALKSVV